MAALMVIRITNDASKNFARLHSSEAVEKFNSYINRDLSLVRMVSRSKAVTQWFSDEENQLKRAVAYDEMMNYAGLMQSPTLYFGIQQTLNEYSIAGEAMLEDFVPFDWLDPDIAYNNWYFDCINSENEYTLNIDIDKVTDTALLWINYKVMENTDVVGVFCSGLPFSEMSHNLFDPYNIRDVKGYIIDKHGFIMMDSSFSGLYSEGIEISIPEAVSDPSLALVIESYLHIING
jgi:hypothetical protein